MCGRIILLDNDELLEVMESIRRRRKPRHAQGRHIPDIEAHDGDRNADQGNFPAFHPEADNGDARRQARVGDVVCALVGTGADIEVERLRWGIKPDWNPKPLFNTRIETALGRGGMWGKPIREGRCILPAAAFFETHATETGRNPETGRPAKRAYEFWLPDAEPLLLASIRVAGQLSVVTTRPNASVAPIHPRMPLVLRFEEVPLWLEGSIDDIARLADRSDLPLLTRPELRAAAAVARRAEQLSLFE